MAHAGKVLLKIISRRLSRCCEKESVLLYEQCGFQPGCSIIDMKLVSSCLQELVQRQQTPLYTFFICLVKAYDSVGHASCGIPWSDVAPPSSHS